MFDKIFVTEFDLPASNGAIATLKKRTVNQML